MFKRLDLSPRGWARVVIWTIFGTLGCMAVSVWSDSFNFMTFSEPQRIRSIITDLVVPLVLAAPLLCFFTTKLRELAIANHRLAVHASIDSLTSLLNRGAFTAQVDRHLSREAGGQPVVGALLVVDADNFKRINDGFGHDAGDEALRIIAQAIKGALREDDVVGRMGGEEFGVFLPGANPEEAKCAGERIRRAVAEAEFLPEGIESLSVSVGGVIFDREIPFRELYRTADQRLYKAKEAGRNQVFFTAVEAGLPSAAAA